MPQTPPKQSPLMSRYGAANHPHPIKVREDFWVVWGYYQYKNALYITRSAEEDFDPPLMLPPGTYFVCQDVTERPISTEMDGPSLLSVTLLALHPEDEREMQVDVFPQTKLGFSRIENEMEIIAIAATGLAL